MATSSCSKGKVDMPCMGRHAVMMMRGSGGYNCHAGPSKAMRRTQAQTMRPGLCNVCVPMRVV